jgi:hypothetical protein
MFTCKYNLQKQTQATVPAQPLQSKSNLEGKPVVIVDGDNHVEQVVSKHVNASKPSPCITSTPNQMKVRPNWTFNIATASRQRECCSHSAISRRRLLSLKTSRAKLKPSQKTMTATLSVSGTTTSSRLKIMTVITMYVSPFSYRML